MRAKVVSQVRHRDGELLRKIPLESPFVVYIEPSGRCNLRCSFCPQSLEDPTVRKDIMSMRTWTKAIYDMSKFPQKTKVLRVCGNGETLLNPAIVEMLWYAWIKGVAVTTELVTNGTLLSHRDASTIAHYVNRIVVSVYGTDISDKVRMLYHNRGDCTIHVKAVAGINRDGLYKTYGDICDEIYIENAVPMWPRFAGAPDPNSFRYGGELIPRRVCSQIFKGFQIQADGEVVPCCVDWRRVNVIGNVNDQSLLDIWNGEKLRRLQQEHLKGNKDGVEPCRACRMNDYCDIDNIDGVLG